MLESVVSMPVKKNLFAILRFSLGLAKKRVPI